MSEETKEPLEETPVTAETAETEQEKTPENQEPEKKAKKKEKKEKGITFTREQVEKMELAAKQLESVKDQFTRLTAEYDNYRKRTTKEKDGIYQDAKATPSRPSWRCMTIWNGPQPPRAARTIPTKRDWR